MSRTLRAAQRRESRREMIEWRVILSFVGLAFFLVLMNMTVGLSTFFARLLH